MSDTSPRGFVPEESTSEQYRKRRLPKRFDARRVWRGVVRLFFIGIAVSPVFLWSRIGNQPTVAVVTSDQPPLAAPTALEAPPVRRPAEASRASEPPAYVDDEPLVPSLPEYKPYEEPPDEPLVEEDAPEKSLRLPVLGVLKEDDFSLDDPAGLEEHPLRVNLYRPVTRHRLADLPTKTAVHKVRVVGIHHFSGDYIVDPVSGDVDADHAVTIRFPFVTNPPSSEPPTRRAARWASENLVVKIRVTADGGATANGVSTISHLKFEPQVDTTSGGSVPFYHDAVVEQNLRLMAPPRNIKEAVWQPVLWRRLMQMKELGQRLMDGAAIMVEVVPADRIRGVAAD